MNTSHPKSSLLPKALTYHKPALLQNALDFLAIIPGNRYVDATLGGAGHTLGILNYGGKVLAIDQDSDALDYCSSLQALQPALVSKDLLLVNSNFIHLEDILLKHSWSPVSGIILDLGVSSHQLDSPNRGFSFKNNSALDMRMDQNSMVMAGDLLNTLSLPELANLLKVFGEIPVAKTLAAKIINSRPLRTTQDLSLVTGKWTRLVFQAVRIAVNDELGALSSFLPQAEESLESHGRLVVISFHSLEDRIVKQEFNHWQQQGIGKQLTRHPVIPSADQLIENPRSYSAKLRAFQKN